MSGETACAVYFKNGIGNLIMFSAAMKALSDWKGCVIDVATDSDWLDVRKSAIREICEGFPYVRNWIEYPRDNFNIRNYDLLYATSHNGPSLAMDIFKGNGHFWDSPEWRKMRRHEVEFYMDGLHAIGYNGITPPIQMPVASSPRLPGFKGLTIAICNGAAKSETWRWERKKWWGFHELCASLWRYYGARIVLLGGDSDVGEMNELKRKLPSKIKVIDKTGKTSITQTAKVLTQCNILVSSDTSVMHIAAAVGTPVVGIFGSTLISKNSPWTDNSAIIRSPLKCSSCQHIFVFNLCKDQDCMKAIKPGDVFLTVREFLSKIKKRSKKGKGAGSW